jgi:hypothetical protein
MQLLSQEPISMHRPVFSPAALVLLITLGAGTALAQQEGPAPAAQRPCAADVARLCPNAQGRKDVHACLKQNADQVSAECKARIEQIQQKFQAAKEACQSDVEKFCANVQPGGRRVGACLREHASELSQACQAAVPAKKGG